MISNNNLIVTSCDWIQVERNFTVNDYGFTTLVIYAERGGALLDDIEVFENCNSDVYIQNKNYGGILFAPNAIEGYNFREKAGANLIVGNSVDANKPFGNVFLQQVAKLILQLQTRLNYMMVLLLNLVPKYILLTLNVQITSIV